MRFFKLVLGVGMSLLSLAFLRAEWPTDSEGNPLFVKGVTFTIENTLEDPQRQQTALREVKNIGANAIRTWGVGQDTQALLDNADAEGLKVLLGLWLEHGRDGAEGDGNLNYASHEERKQRQREIILRDVARYKNHPALLGWGVGNEVVLNIATEEQKVAYAIYLEELVKEIKMIDPNHMVMSVSAWTISVPYWEKYTPSLDVYGINAYGPAVGAIPLAMKEAGATKPFLVTEFGPRGAWDSDKDEFGVSIMPTDLEKYDHIARGWQEWITSNQSEGSRGGFIFNFSDDWSPTGIWLGFYLKGAKRPAYWATREAFTGKKPEVALQTLEGLMVSPKTVNSGGTINVGVEPLQGDASGEIQFFFSPEFGGRDHSNQIFDAEAKRYKDHIWKLTAPKDPGVYCIYASKRYAGDNVTITQSSVNVKASLEISTSEKVDTSVIAMAASPALAMATATLMQISAPRSRGSQVKIVGDISQGFQLLKNGQPFRILGAGGSNYFDVMAENGGNAIRTWGVGKDTPGILDKAHANGLSVTVGLWLGHERHGFDYSDPKQLADQRADVKKAVEQFRDHPALLSWGLGNEMEGIQNRGDSPVIWKEINYLAKMIKELDPYHPVMTVVANVNPEKVKAIQTYAPAVDILGVNAYAGAQNIGKNLRSFDWNKPYAVTEYGLPGPWEVELTAWGAPIEPTSREKAGFYYVSTKGILEDTKQCLGSYAFLWGNKQEATASWFGMFLPSGEKTPRVDAITKVWTGEWPSNRAPILKEIVMPVFNRKIKAGERFDLKARYEDSDGDTITYTWEIFKESTDRKVGGDAEAVPEMITGVIRAIDQNGSAQLIAPRAKGAYRVFVTVKDGKGSGCMDNWPFYVE